jgi:hypothetical protein
VAEGVAPVGCGTDGGFNNSGVFSTAVERTKAISPDISLTPGFSPVNRSDGDVQPLQRLSHSVRSR